MKVIISNDMKNYFSGKSDGIQFLNVEDSDVEIIKSLATKYNKEIKLVDSFNYSTNKDTESTVEDVEEPIIKPKERKVWVNDGDQAKRINECDLPEYLNKGYKVGKKIK